jgi:gluconate 2-dehydrogenase alpha chain
MCIYDFNGDNFDHSEPGFIRGGIVSFGASEATPIGLSRTAPPSVPGWGSEYKRWVVEGAQSIAGCLMQLEVLPYEDNFLDLDPEVTDPDGVPVIRVTFDIKENEYAAAEYFLPRFEEIFREMGAAEAWSTPVAAMPILSHAYGGTRAGDDPATSVVDRNCLAHEVPNLAVLGASCFPSTAGYNPTETVEAWAWMAAEYIAQHFDDIANG